VALIYRAILEIEDANGTFVERAPSHVIEWMRFKFRDDPLPGLSPEDSSALLPHGIELTTVSGANDECRVCRVSAYEGARDDGTEVKTTLTAIRESTTSWAWVTLNVGRTMTTRSPGFRRLQGSSRRCSAENLQAVAD
jgi:hypothetical protein